MTTRRIPIETGENYHDNGCRVYPKCLECPLPRCVLTLGEDCRTMTTDELRTQFQLMHSRGVSVDALKAYTFFRKETIVGLLT